MRCSCRSAPTTSSSRNWWSADSSGLPVTRRAGFGGQRCSQWLPLLPGRYDALAAALGNLTPHDDRVLIAEYFDPTRDDAGQPCDGTILNDHPAGSPLFGITAAEAAWASNVMLTGLLNAEVASAAEHKHGWEFVGGITSQFFNHGYCAADHWVVRWRRVSREPG